MTEARITQLGSELLYSERDPYIRVAGVAANVIGATDTTIRVAGTSVNAIGSFSETTIRVAGSFVNIVYKRLRNVFYADEDIVIGGWTDPPLYSGLYKPNGKGIKSKKTPSNDTAEVGMQDIEGWDSSQDLIFRLQVSKIDDAGNAVDDGDTLDLTVNVYDNKTLVESFLLEDIKGDMAIVELSVSSTNRTKINKPTKLTIEFIADTTTPDAGNGRRIKIHFLEMDNPEPALGPPSFGTVAAATSDPTRKVGAVVATQRGFQRLTAFNPEENLFGQYAARFDDRRYYHKPSGLV